MNIAVFALCVDQLWTICGYTIFAFCDEQSIESVFEQGPSACHTDPGRGIGSLRFVC